MQTCGNYDNSDTCLEWPIDPVIGDGNTACSWENKVCSNGACVVPSSCLQGFLCPSGYMCSNGACVINNST